MRANRSTNDKMTIAGRNDGTGLVASASVLPLAWTNYSWNVEIYERAQPDTSLLEAGLPRYGDDKQRSL